MPSETSIYWKPAWDPTKGVKGSDVPRVTGEELVTAMRSNVAEAMENLAKARTNLHRLRVSQRVVVDTRTQLLRAVLIEDPKTKKMVGDPDGEVGIADWQRAAAELAHWNEYLGWAKSERDSGAALPDRRLPVESDLEEAPF